MDRGLTTQASRSGWLSLLLAQGLPGDDECFGTGIDALRAVLHDASQLYDGTAPFCPEYAG